MRRPGKLRFVRASCLLLSSCAAHDPQQHLNAELAFLKGGVHIEDEEREVRRVFAQRGLRVVARLSGPDFIALGAATRRGEQSAVRIVSQRGVVLAEDGSLQDLFQPSTVALIEHFGGTFGDYVLAASARVPAGRDLGCVRLYRVLADGQVVECTIDLSPFGSSACVANLAPAGGNRVRATLAWPELYALSTPLLEVELALDEPLPGRPLPTIPVLKLVKQGDWLDGERTRLSTKRLARAPFSERHAVGVARAALAALAGVDTRQQVGMYREAVHAVPPGSPEAEIMVATVAHIERGWSDPEESEELPAASSADESATEVAPADAIVIEPEELEQSQ